MVPNPADNKTRPTAPTMKAVPMDFQTENAVLVQTRTAIKASSASNTLERIQSALQPLEGADEMTKALITTEAYRVLRSLLARIDIGSEEDLLNISEGLYQRTYLAYFDIPVSAEQFTAVLARAQYGHGTIDGIPKTISRHAIAALAVAATLRELVEDLDEQSYGEMRECPIDRQEGSGMDFIGSAGELGPISLSLSTSPVTNLSAPFTLPFGQLNNELTNGKTHLCVTPKRVLQLGSQWQDLLGNFAVPLSISDWDKVYPNGISPPLIADLESNRLIKVLSMGLEKDLASLEGVVLYCDCDVLAENDQGSLAVARFADGYSMVLSPVFAFAMRSADNGEDLAAALKQAMPQGVVTPLALETLYRDLISIIWGRRGYLGELA